jgi:hypothetical protein
MKKVIKIGVVIYFACVFPLLYIIAVFFILKPNPAIYSYVPQDADIVIELNSKNFIREIGFQRIYNEDYFLRKIPSSDEESLIEESPLNTGINFFSQLLIFRENWVDEEIWYSVLKIDNQKDFNAYLESKQMVFEKCYSGNYVVIQLTKSEQQKKVSEHLHKIANKEVKTFNSKVSLSEVFSSDNEINIYIAPNNSKHIIDGYLYLNFLEDKIVINGHFTPISQNEEIPFIAYKEESELAFSLRSSLNLFNSLYIFNNQTLENLPEYNQLSMDFNGTKMLTSNETIPLIAYPKLNLQFDIYDADIWNNYLTELNQTEGLNVDYMNQKISLNTDAKSVIKYNLDDSEFSLFQTPNSFECSEKNGTYLSLNIKPGLFVENTTFVKDSINPPNLIANLKISIFQSLIEDDMSYWNEFENINFSITDDKENAVDFKSDGLILYKEKKGHSMIESFVIVENFIGTVVPFLSGFSTEK